MSWVWLSFLSSRVIYTYKEIRKLIWNLLLQTIGITYQNYSNYWNLVHFSLLLSKRSMLKQLLCKSHLSNLVSLILNPSSSSNISLENHCATLQSISANLFRTKCICKNEELRKLMKKVTIVSHLSYLFIGFSFLSSPQIASFIKGLLDEIGITLDKGVGIHNDNNEKPLNSELFLFWLMLVNILFSKD